MKFLPYERLKINTALSREQILKRLENAIEQKRYFRRFGPGTKPYQGKLEVSRIIGYRNSFLPVIKGDVQSEISGCSVYITMHPHILVTADMIVWLGGMGFIGFLYSLLASFTEPHTTDPSVVLMPGGLFVFGYAIFLGGFKFESIQSKRFFRELFEAREVEEMGIANPFETAG